MPYDKAYEVPGTGFLSDGLYYKANPFKDASKMELTNDRTVEIGEVVHKVSTNLLEHAEALKDTANLNFDDWDFRAQSKFANAGTMDDFMPNQISFLASRHIDFGTRQF